jgi:hypothetical protein
MGMAAFCRRRRWVTCVAVAAYALIVSGLPLPLGLMDGGGRSDATGQRLLSGKDRSRPFPCRDKPCGCVSAEQCFKKCCCHTPAQLLAWARRNDLEPAVLAALARRVATEAPVETLAATCRATRAVAATAACCAPKSARAVEPRTVTDCCTAARRPAAAHPEAGGRERAPDADGDCDMCRDDRSLAGGATSSIDPATPRDAPDPGEEPLSTRTLVLRSMLACGGIVAEWFSIGGAPPPPAVVAVACVSPLAVTLVDRDESPRPRHVAPDVPPPRVA